eukprot:999429-Amphidinium_carterae.2
MSQNNSAASLTDNVVVLGGEPMYMRHLIQPVATEDSELYWGVPHATAVAPPPCDDAASVRMSTDSTSMHQAVPSTEMPLELVLLNGSFSALRTHTPEQLCNKG